MFCSREYQLTSRFNQQNEKSISSLIFMLVCSYLLHLHCKCLLIASVSPQNPPNSPIFFLVSFENCNICLCSKGHCTSVKKSDLWFLLLVRNWQRFLLVTVVYSNSSTSSYIQVLKLKIQDSHQLFINRNQLETSKQTFLSKTWISLQNSIVQC